MTDLREAFPRYAEVSNLMPTDDGPPLSFDWDDARAMAAFINLVTAEQNASSADLARVNTLSLALYDDVLEQRERLADLEATRAVDFLQFWITISPLGSATGRRRFSMARDWAARALVDNYDAMAVGQPMHVERLIRFAQLTNPTLRAQVDLALLEWATHLFYVSWATGDHLPMARATAPYLLTLAFAVLGGDHQVRDLADDALGAALSITRWLDRYDGERAAQPARLLSEFEDHEGYPDAPRLRVALLLSGPPGRRTGMAPEARAARTLSRYGHLLKAHERLALLGSSVAGRADEALRRFDEILAAVDEYAAFLAPHPAVDRLYDRGRLFGQVGGLVRTLAIAGYAQAAFQLLGRWHGVSDPRTDAVLLMAADPDGTRWITEGRLEPAPDNALTLGPLIRITNEALGLMVTDLDAHEEGMPQPARRPGIPDFSVARAYEDACERHLRLEGLVAQDPDRTSRAIVAVPGLAVPLCALARRTTGVQHPLAVSLQRPLDDRPIRKVAVWASELAGSEEETDAVEAAFAAAGVEVEIVRREQTVECFRDLYERDDFDVLWVACHGEHAAFEPERSKLTLGVGHEVAFEELLTFRVPDTPRRRLIVLNACDSATAAQFGGLAEFGIGSAMAGAAQAVIGHLWPVPFTEAAGFGALLAGALAGEMPYIDAFGHATAALEGGIEAMLAALADQQPPGGILDRLTAARDREHGLLHWGSPVFLE